MSRFIVFQSFNKFATPATEAAILAPGKLPALQRFQHLHHNVISSNSNSNYSACSNPSDLSTPDAAATPSPQAISAPAAMTLIIAPTIYVPQHLQLYRTCSNFINSSTYRICTCIMYTVY
jgi:hypothetical protein